MAKEKDFFSYEEIKDKPFNEVYLLFSGGKISQSAYYTYISKIEEVKGIGLIVDEDKISNDNDHAIKDLHRQIADIESKILSKITNSEDMEKFIDTMDGNTIALGVTELVKRLEMLNGLYRDIKINKDMDNYEVRKKSPFSVFINELEIKYGENYILSINEEEQARFVRMYAKAFNMNEDDVVFFLEQSRKALVSNNSEQAINNSVEVVLSDNADLLSEVSNLITKLGIGEYHDKFKELYDAEASIYFDNSRGIDKSIIYKKAIELQVRIKELRNNLEAMLDKDVKPSL